MGQLVSGKEHSSGFETHPDYLMRILPARRHIRVLAKGEVVAETDNALELFEGEHAPVFYIPRRDVKMGRFAISKNLSWSPFKGEARYWDVKLGDEKIPAAAWSYEDPFVEVAAIRDYIAFSPDKVTIDVQ
ncbi:DUF427 domain-containing protein [Parvibaculum sp.]|jgi:uncharacterized protein (DUF427 family)|uniref:DUF427 domain-containing protein n=1 Tax=Parvibaculum sp. TaxID=2024848 RepID=UPI003C76282C